MKIKVDPHANPTWQQFARQYGRYVLREWDSFAEGIEEMKKELAKHG